MVNMRVEWFTWVSKTRKKMQRGRKERVSHRMAMKSAALTWPKEKTKILNRIKREERERGQGSAEDSQAAFCKGSRTCELNGTSQRSVRKCSGLRSDSGKNISSRDLFHCRTGRL